MNQMGSKNNESRLLLLMRRVKYLNRSIVKVINIQDMKQLMYKYIITMARRRKELRKRKRKPI